MTKQIQTVDWKYELIKRFTSPGHANVHSIRQMNLDHKKIGELLEFIEKILEQAQQEALLQLLAMFDDYNHPIQMTAEYVREQIIKFMEENHD